MKHTLFSKHSSPLSFVFALGVFVFSFGFLFYRSRIGVDFFDEPYYAALALRLHLGQKPFIDELYLAQTFSLLTFPLLKIYWAINQSLEGIISFYRMANAVLYLGLGYFIFSAFKTSVGKSMALLIAAACPLFFPGNMTTLGYNSLGSFFLTVSLITYFIGMNKSTTSLFALSGIFMGLSCISYVTFCAMALFFFFYSLIFEKKKERALFFALGVALVLLWPLRFILADWASFLKSVEFGKEYHHEAPSLLKLVEVIHKFFPKTVIALFAMFLGLCHWAHKYSSKAFDLLLMSVPLVAALCCNLSYSFWSGYPFYLSLLSLSAFYRLTQNYYALSLLKWIFFPSFIAGLITAGTSASGFINAQVGLLPATLAGLSFLGLGLSFSSLNNSLSRIAALALPVFLLLFYPLNVWSDAEFSQLTQKITLGPYRGLYTAPEKKKIAEESFSILKPLLTTQGPLLIYPNSPSGYLVNPVPPAKGVVWYENSGRTNEILAGLYKEQMNPDSRVIRMKVWYASPTVKSTHHFDAKDPLNQLIESTHHVIQETQWFTVFAPNPAPSRG